MYHKLAIARAGAICESNPFRGSASMIPPPITNIAKAICESLFAGRKAAAACKQISTGLIHVIKISGTSFLPNKRRLRHVRRPQQGYYMFQKPRNVTFAEKKAPAARKKTSAGRLHVLKIPATSIWAEKKRLRHVRRPHQATIHK